MNQSKIPARGRALFFVAGFLLFFAAIFGGVGWIMLRGEQRFDSGGATVQGSVIGKRTETRKERNGDRPYYWVRYRFIPEGAQPIESEDPVSYELFEQLSENSPIPIQYERANPDSNRVAESSDGGNASSYVLLVIGLVVGALGGALLWYEMQQRRLAKRLVEEGMIADATIVSVGPGSLAISKVVQWRISYSFRDTRGQEITATSPHMDPFAAQQWQVGQKGKVRYDRDNPKSSILVGR